MDGEMDTWTAVADGEMDGEMDTWTAVADGEMDGEMVTPRGWDSTWKCPGAKKDGDIHRGANLRGERVSSHWRAYRIGRKHAGTGYQSLDT